MERINKPNMHMGEERKEEKLPLFPSNSEVFKAAVIFEYDPPIPLVASHGRKNN